MGTALSGQTVELCHHGVTAVMVMIAFYSSRSMLACEKSLLDQQDTHGPCHKEDTVLGRETSGAWPESSEAGGIEGAVIGPGGLRCPEDVALFRG